MKKNKKIIFITILIILAIITTLTIIFKNSFSNTNNIDEWNKEKLVNSPKLSTGMSPIVFNEKGESTIIDVNSDWYNYEQQESTTIQGGTSKWANAQTKDGSQWVWIPRFAYKINYNDDEHKEKGGNIEIKF